MPLHSVTQLKLQLQHTRP